MADWLLFCLFVTFGILTLVIVPIAAHPGLKPGKKLLFIFLLFLVLVVGSIALYLGLGAPMLAGL